MLEDYITSRLDPQILYYKKRSALFRREYNVLSILTLFLMAAIPFLTLLLDLASSVRFAIAAVGITALILSGILYFHNAKEQWHRCHALVQSLQAEKASYLYSAGSYQSIDAQREKDALLVAACEAILSNAEK